MVASTLTALQNLKDAEFHTLCDEMLPRIFARYHPLVPHGRNERGDSIRGQPDSYVGDTAETCRIAIQHTVQQDSWWSKAVEDVEEARKACPKAVEVVIVLPRDIDREKPKKGKGVSWHQDAKKAAAPANLTVIHGRTLTEQLDTACQDLRFIYFDIPFSRLSWHAIVAGCRESSIVTLQRLESLGRYEPSRYVDREADNRFFRLWQESLRVASGHSSSSERRLLIPLVADSGIGKTSLLARFTERTSRLAPVLLLLARDLSFEKSDTLTAHVIDRLQGSMDAGSRISEESHLAMLLAGKTPLTVVLDGLDETTNVTGVQQAIGTWIWSRLGRSSVLVVSSRPEFWRNCRDATWSNSILRDEEHPKAAKSLRHEKDLARLDPMQGIELPGQFTPHELSKAWGRGGQCEDEFWRLPAEVRREMLHPFTMKSALDLLATGKSLDQLRTRSAILNLWIQSRLRAEVDSEARVTETQYRECLLTVARMAASNESSWVAVDDLETVPRFDRSNPPGTAAERLIAANILETHPNHHDQIRFSFEAVHDFFLAESMVGDVAKSPGKAAKDFAKLAFSTAVTRLERIGDQIASQPFREQFVQSLAELDGPKAAVVLRPGIDSYSSESRARVISKVAQLLASRMDAERALATELLGRLRCPESSDALEAHWTANHPTMRVHALVSSAAISHGIVALVPHVFQTWWFTHEDFFVDLRPELLATTRDFRNTLVEYASKFIPSNEHSDDYQRALMILAYLNDERAIEAIKQRNEDAVPFFYESLSLLAIGSRRAVEVYSLLIDAYLEVKKAGLEGKQLEEWRFAAVPHARVGNLVTPEVEDFVSIQMDSEDTDRQLIGRFLAEWLGTDRLLAHMVKRLQVKGYTFPVNSRLGRRLGSDKWIELWDHTSTAKEKEWLIGIAGDLCDTRVEDVLLECLEDSELSGYCAASLAAMGSQRACPAILKLLTTEGDITNGKDRNRSMAFHALTSLRDSASVVDIVRYLESKEGANEYYGTVGLASIGTEEAEKALLELNNQSDELLARGLVHCGSRKCVERAVQIAMQRGSAKGAAWLAEKCRFSFWGLHGKSFQQYRTDVDIEPLLDFVLAQEPTEEVRQHLCSMLEGIDSPAVRRVFREWYDLRDTPDDIALKEPKDRKLSSIAFRELAGRGDDHVLTAHIESEIERFKDHRIHSWVIERLAVFDRAKVRRTLRSMLKDDGDDKARRAVVDLIGHVGADSDICELDRLIESESDRVANAAFEAKLRLTDPMRLAEYW